MRCRVLVAFTLPLWRIQYRSPLPSSKLQQVSNDAQKTSFRNSLKRPRTRTVYLNRSCSPFCDEPPFALITERIPAGSVLLIQEVAEMVGELANEHRMSRDEGVNAILLEWGIDAGIIKIDDLEEEDD